MKDKVKNLELSRWIEPFYTGGSVQWSSDGKTVFTVCGSVVKALNIEDGVPSYDIGNADDQSEVTCALLGEKPLSSMTVAYANGLITRYLLHPAVGDVRGTAEVNRCWKSLHSAPIRVMKYCSSENLLASGSADFTVKVWKMDSQNCLGTLKGPSATTQIAFVDSSRIIVGYADGSSYFFDLKLDKKLIHKWKLHSSQIVSVMLPEKGIASFVSRDQTISRVSLETYEKLKIVPIFEPVECSISFGQNLYTVGEEGTLKCWQSDGAKLIRSAKISNCRVDLILHNPVRSQFLLVSCDFNLYLVNANNFVTAGQYVGFNDEIFDVTFIGEEEKTLIVAANSRDIRIYDVRTWSCRLLSGHTDSVLSVTPAHWDSCVFASSSKDNSFILWRLNSDSNGFAAEKLAIATGHTNSVTSVEFSKMSKRKFVLSVSHDMTLKLWSLAALSSTECVKLSTSSTLVAHAKDITCLDVSANDRLCVTGSMDKSAKLWHIDTKTMQLGIAGTLPGHRRGVWDVRFCDATQVVGTCSGDCCVRVFSVTSRECIATLSGHSFAVLHLIFVNHGRQIISADSGGLLKIWNVSTKDCETTVEGHDDKIWTLVATSDESRFVTAGSDGRIGIWDDVTEKKNEEEERLRAKKVQDDQTLLNLMEQQRFSEALSFALTLEKPYNCLKVISSLIEEQPKLLNDAVIGLSDEQVVTLLDFVSHWNTNSRTALIAQQTLNRLLRLLPPNRLLETSNFASVLESLLPYTKRHFERISRLQESAAFLDYVWSQMRLPDVTSA